METRSTEVYEQISRVRPGHDVMSRNRHKTIRRAFENAILNRVDRQRRESVRNILAEVDESDPIAAILKSRGQQGGRTLFERLCAAGRMPPRELRQLVREVQRELRGANDSDTRG
jgi:hypothetical protein